MAVPTRTAARTDSNHAEIRDGLRDLGWSVFDASGVGDGFPDLVVGVGQPGAGVANALLEVKSGARGTLTVEQVEFHGKWRGPLFVVRSLDEAIAAVRSAVRAGAARAA